MMAFELGHQSALPGSITDCQPSDLDWDICSVDFGFASLHKSASHFLITITIFYKIAQLQTTQPLVSCLPCSSGSWLEGRDHDQEQLL